MKSFSHEMINMKLTIVRDEQTPRTLKNDIASDFLDRAGYGARKKLDVETHHSVSIPLEAAKRLTDALDSSMRIADIDYSPFIAQKLLEGEVQSESLALTPSAGHTEAPVETSLDTLPAAPTQDDPKLAERLARDEWPAALKRRRSA